MFNGVPVSLPATKELSLHVVIVLGEYRHELKAAIDGGIFGVGWSALAENVGRDFAAWCAANRELLLARRASRVGR
jgi:hypothetical protein